MCVCVCVCVHVCAHVGVNVRAISVLACAQRLPVARFSKHAFTCLSFHGHTCSPRQQPLSAWINDSVARIRFPDPGEVQVQERL